MRFKLNPQLNPAAKTGWRRQMFDIIYRHDPGPPRNFDIALILMIVLSVVVVMLDSVESLHAHFRKALYIIEWGFTLLFTIEYIIRLAVVRRPLRYALSIWGIIDLVSILPTYISVLVPGAQNLLVVRVLRILRLFRILRLTQYMEESGLLMSALWRSRRKIFVFLCAVMTIVVIFASVMYLVESPENGFTNIPNSMYWAIVTMATVGYGDIAPHTALGRAISSVLILIGYSIIAVPTGIYTAELANSLLQANAEQHAPHDHRGCPECGLEGHETDAAFCRKCGHVLPKTIE